jgi:hypothetical protein
MLTTLLLLQALSRTDPNEAAAVSKVFDGCTEHENTPDRKPAVSQFKARPRQIGFRARKRLLSTSAGMPFALCSSHNSHCIAADSSKAAERTGSLLLALLSSPAWPVSREAACASPSIPW